MRFALLFWFSILTGCTSNESETSLPSDSVAINDIDVDSLDAVAARKARFTLQHQRGIRGLALLQTSDSILGCFKRKDFVALAAFIHPERGVRFSPYGYVDTASDVRLSRDSLLSIVRSGETIDWGWYDAADDSIMMPIAEYVDRFIYDRDFRELERAVNENLYGPTTTLHNQNEVYPTYEFVSYRFPGEHPESEGMDWSGLTLIFDAVDDVHYLVGIIHDEWTI